MKQIIIFSAVLVLSSITVRGVAQSYQVQYLEKLLLSEKVKEALAAPSIIKEMVDHFNNVDFLFTLEIQDKESYYIFEKVSIIDSTILDPKRRSFAYNSVKNHATEFVAITPAKSREFKVYEKKYRHPSDWEIDYASYKTLLGLKAYKATLKDAAGVAAWFCPEIPVSDGPGIYSGLPGLILEVQSTKVHITAIGLSQADQPFDKIPWDDITVLERKEWIEWTTVNSAKFNVLDKNN